MTNKIKEENLLLNETERNVFSNDRVEKKNPGEILDLTSFFARKEKAVEESSVSKRADDSQNRGEILDLTSFFARKEKAVDESSVSKRADDSHNGGEILDLTSFFARKEKAVDESSVSKRADDSHNGGEILDLTSFFARKEKAVDESSVSKRADDSHNGGEILDLTSFFARKEKAVDESSVSKRADDSHNGGEILDLTSFFARKEKAVDESSVSKRADDSPNGGEILDLTSFFARKEKAVDESSVSKRADDSHNGGEILDLTSFFARKEKAVDESSVSKRADDSHNGGEILDLTSFFARKEKAVDESSVSKRADDSHNGGEILDLTSFFARKEKAVEESSVSKRADDSHNGGEILDLTSFFARKEKAVEESSVSKRADDSHNGDNAVQESLTDGKYGEILQCYDDDIPQDSQGYKLFPDKIMADLMEECRCKPQCNDILFEDCNIVLKVQQFRSEYYGIPQGNPRSTKLLRLIRDSLMTDNRRRFHHFQGKKLCQKKWTDLLGISIPTYYRMLSYIKDDYVEVDVAKKICHNYRGLTAVGFIDKFLENNGDPSPEREVILLPDCININYMYEEYMNTPGIHIKKRWFYRLFEENFSETVSFAKTKNINPCDICLKFKMEMFKLTDTTEKEQLKNDLKIHLERQRQERHDYYRKKAEAKMKPNEFMSLIVDGMDQSKTNIPHFKGWTRPKSGSAALKTHITGCLVHHRRLHLYTDLLQWPHDPNLTITCLIDAISTDIDALPPTLYIQCDNCGRENKNKYVIGFLGYLCLAGYVKEVHLSFLIKGHTHEDIDQRFSKISHRLRQVHALTLPDLQKEVRSSFQDQPHTDILHCVWDVKQWIDSCLCDISAHSYQHQFWLYCDRPNHVNFKYRRFSTDSWQPENDDQQLELFELNLNGDHISPPGVPKYVTPHYEAARMESVRSAIEKTKTFLTFDQFNWWKDFLENPDQYVNRQLVWPLLKLKKVNRVLDIPKVPESTQPSCINSMIVAEGVVREVTTKKKRKNNARK